MDKKLKAKWLKALRSGKYKQGKGVLRTADNRFCCMGVLVDVMSKKAWPKVTTEIGTLILGAEHSVMAYEVEQNGTALDYDTMRRIGLETRHQGDLINMNDAGKRFTTIADYIEAEL